MLNEWVAFGIVAVICGLLAILVRMSGSEASGDMNAHDQNPDEIPDDPYFGLTPLEMSRAIVAIHSKPREPGRPADPARPVGFWPTVSTELQLSSLRDEFGPEADVDRIRHQEQLFSDHVSPVLKLDWSLPNDEFDRAVADGLRRHFPELTEDARRVITGSYSYSHAK